MQSALREEAYGEEPEQQYDKQPGQESGNRLYTFMLVVLLLSSLIVGAVLVYAACRYSYYPQKDYNLNDLLLEDSFVMHILLVGILGVLTWWLESLFSKKLTFRMQERICRIVLAITAVLLFAAGTVFVHTNPYYPTGDQLNTTAGAYYCLEGNYIMLSPGGYIGLYQQQKGFMFLYEILFSIFGAFCYDVAKQFHVIFMVLTLLSGYGFIKLHSEKAFYRILFCIIMLFCVPFIIFLPYIYGDIPSICFCMVLFWALSAYEKRLQKRYVAIAAVAAALSLMCRMNTWIVLIAVAIGILLMAVERWDYKPLLVGLCVILTASGTIKAIDVMYEYRSGYESGIGIPSILWVAMGLQETDGEAGVYNRYQQTVFEENGFDREISTQIGVDYIAQRVEEFQNDLPMAQAFFRDKMRSQWIEPLFESLAATDSFQEEKPVAEWILNLYYGNLHDIVWKGTNYYQSVVYVAVLLCMLGRCMRLKQSKDGSIGWIPQIAVVGGFLFSLIWENQSRYCLPYYVFMLLYVPEGIMQIGGCIDGLRKKLLSGKHTVRDEKDKQQLEKVS